MSNPFYIDPWGGYGDQFVNAMGGLGKVLGDRHKAKKRQEIRSQGQAIFDSGDPDQIADFMIANPEIGEDLQGAVAFKNEQTQKNLGESALRYLAGEPLDQILSERVNFVTSQGGDPSDTLQLQAEHDADPERFRRTAEMVAAQYAPEGYKAYREANKPVEFQQGVGAMSGYTFNPSTGEYKLNPEARGALINKAESARLEAERKGKIVDAKTRQGINKDFTALIKDAVATKKSADDLGALKTKGSAAAKLAAVFKFMKALDPTSVVRESEQGQVYAAQGAAAQIAGMLNNLTGEGKLTEAGFQDVVDTAKAIANSQLSGASSEAASYLDSYEDTLPQSFKDNLLKRIPEGYAVGPKTLPDGVTEAEIAYTMNIHGLTRDEVLSRLEVRDAP